MALFDAFNSDLTQRALLGGLVAATITALVGTWVVVRGMAFFGDALAHGVLPGIAAATLLGISPLFGAVMGAVVLVGGVSVVRRTNRLSEDTAIGLLFVGMLALGVVIISSSDSFAGDLTTVLFGDVLGIQPRDIWLGGAGIVVTIIGLVLGHRSFLALSMNVDKAAALGLRPGVAHAGLLVLLALSVVVSFRMVGTLLVFGFLVAPASAAVLIVRRIPLVMVVAVAIGWLSVIIGLLVSYHLDTAASATIAGVGVSIFFCVLGATELYARLVTASPVGPAATNEPSR